MFEFSLDGYQNLLRLISDKFQVLNFSQSRDQLKKDLHITDICCLRHDVDYCLESALKMAMLENKLNVSSSYFFLVDSNYYNILSKRSCEIITHIGQLGHEIGLHFDISNYEELQHRKMVSFFVNCLELASQKKINAVSYHNPGAIGLENLLLTDQYEGLYNTYCKNFNNAFHYISDSLCRFRDPQIFEKIDKKFFKNIHLLIHPIWWSESEKTRDQKIQGVFDMKLKAFMAEYQEILETYEIEHRLVKDCL